MIFFRIKYNNSGIAPFYGQCRGRHTGNAMENASLSTHSLFSILPAGCDVQPANFIFKKTEFLFFFRLIESYSNV